MSPIIFSRICWPSFCACAKIVKIIIGCWTQGGGISQANQLLFNSGVSGLLSGGVKGGHYNTRQQADDGNYHQKLNQGEAGVFRSLSVHCFD
jgi:hypothetical protein